MASIGMFYLAALAPMIVDKMRGNLDNLCAVKFYAKWIGSNPELKAGKAGSEQHLYTIDTDYTEVPGHASNEGNRVVLEKAIGAGNIVSGTTGIL